MSGLLQTLAPYGATAVAVVIAYITARVQGRSQVELKEIDVEAGAYERARVIDKDVVEGLRENIRQVAAAAREREAYADMRHREEIAALVERAEKAEERAEKAETRAATAERAVLSLQRRLDVLERQLPTPHEET